MKALIWIIVIVVLLLILYSFTKPKTVVKSTTPVKPTNPYLAGLNLVNNVQTANCGKYGNPPCTIKDLQDAGWTPDQISVAQNASQNASSSYMCLTFGIC